MPTVTERMDEIGGHLAFWREAPGDGTPVLWLHGVPDSSHIWDGLLSAAGGVAPDLPGFGRSGKRADFPYSIDGYADWLETFCDRLGLERIRLVMHDWGAVGLALAQRRPEMVERLVAIDVVPFLAGYRWHRVARWWRRPFAGELVMGLTSPRTAAIAAPDLPAPIRDVSLELMDQGTQRAILRLYRSAGPEVLAAAGRDLGRIAAPALVVWGERDPYLPVAFGERLADALPDGRLEIVSGVGHWPWLGRPDVAEAVIRFLTG